MGQWDPRQMVGRHLELLKIQTMDPVGMGEMRAEIMRQGVHYQRKLGTMLTEQGAVIYQRTGLMKVLVDPMAQTVNSHQTLDHLQMGLMGRVVMNPTKISQATTRRLRVIPTRKE